MSPAALARASPFRAGEKAILKVLLAYGIAFIVAMLIAALIQVIYTTVQRLSGGSHK